MDSLDFHIKGIAPIICHNARLSDPLNEWTRAVAEISGKRKKTNADHEELARREWFGGLYLNEAGNPCIPGSNLERMLRDAAAKTKNGKNVQAGAIVPDDAELIYKGPKVSEKLWAAGEFQIRSSVKIGQQRVMRTRPCWKVWELVFTVLFDEEILNPAKIGEFVQTAGQYIGLGDWRPKHGRFEVI